MKEWIFRLTSLLCSFVVWGFGISLAPRRYWQLREINTKALHLMYIWLWEGYYYQEVNKTGSITSLPVHSAMNSSCTISIEIEYSRGLILFHNLMQPIVLIFFLALGPLRSAGSEPHTLISWSWDKTCLSYFWSSRSFSQFLLLVGTTWQTCIVKALLTSHQHFPSGKRIC